jgi:hypothetical protein
MASSDSVPQNSQTRASGN